jgi:hypothetical protein
MGDFMYDLFMCHASEDKEYVRSLAKGLSEVGLKIWYDEFELRVGDSLRGSIENGVKNSIACVIILSPAFIKGKRWTIHELSSIDALEKGNRSKILPIWHNITYDQILEFSPMLADRFAVNSELGIKSVVSALKRAVDPIRGTKIEVPMSENAYNRFIEGEADMSVKGKKEGFANIFEIAAFFEPEDYPLILANHVIEEEAIWNSVYMIFQNYVDSGFIPESYEMGTNEDIRNKLWQIMKQHYNLDRPRSL